MVKEALTFSVRGVEWCIPECLCECVRVWVCVCVSLYRHRGVDGLSTAPQIRSAGLNLHYCTWAECVLVCVSVCAVFPCEINMAFNLALPLLYHHHAILKLIDFQENNHKRYHKMFMWRPNIKDPYSMWSMWNRFRCCESLGCKVCACTMKNWFLWKPSLQWRNLGSHCFYNKTTHSDIFFSLLLGFWIQLRGILLQTSTKRQRGVKFEK